MEIEDWESKRDGRDEEAHTAGRGPSPAVGRAVSFDKALGSTPSSVVSGLQKAHPEHESACGRTFALLCFFSLFLHFNKFFFPSQEIPALPRTWRKRWVLYQVVMRAWVVLPLPKPQSPDGGPGWVVVRLQHMCWWGEGSVCGMCLCLSERGCACLLWLTLPLCVPHHHSLAPASSLIFPWKGLGNRRSPRITISQGSTSPPPSNPGSSVASVKQISALPHGKRIWV